MKAQMLPKGMIMHHEIKFETLKLKAKLTFCTQMNNWEWNMNSFTLLLRFARMNKSERAGLRAFADAFDGKESDFIAAQAKVDGNHFSQMLLVAREQGVDLIDKWDIRKAMKLVEAFPNILPTKFRNPSNVNVTAELVDNDNGDDCDWFVFLETPSFT